MHQNRPVYPRPVPQKISANTETLSGMSLIDAFMVKLKLGKKTRKSMYIAPVLLPSFRILVLVDSSRTVLAAELQCVVQGDQVTKSCCVQDEVVLLEVFNYSRHDDLDILCHAFASTVGQTYGAAVDGL
ncbi:hypothetical protein ElyMa_003050500 [Elysia marginata]|uniref:Uncharacterized protein n=1 Tax=Elysia marginata TaxID=1093978 RepID=A0AAV4IJQ0_9GAST|nr:hypothetical protein ElyMa_003050500 [Elysia marginata]